MERTELYLKTIFCCMACDGEIAKEEIELVKYLSSEYDIFSEVEIETCLNKWISSINENGALFLKEFLNELSEANLSASEQMLVVDFAIRTIEADKRIEYSEIKFKKKYAIVYPSLMRRYWRNIRIVRITCCLILMFPKNRFGVVMFDFQKYILMGNCKLIFQSSNKSPSCLDTLTR